MRPPNVIIEEERLPRACDRRGIGATFGAGSAILDRSRIGIHKVQQQQQQQFYIFYTYYNIFSTVYLFYHYYHYHTVQQATRTTKLQQ